MAVVIRRPSLAWNRSCSLGYYRLDGGEREDVRGGEAGRRPAAAGGRHRQTLREEGLQTGRDETGPGN